MPTFIAALMFGDVNSISIPTDAILITCLLIIFALLGYVFNKIITNETNKFAKKLYEDSNFELTKAKSETQLTLDQKNVKKQRIQKLNFLPTAKSLGIGSLAVLAMGGASLLGGQIIQKSYEGVNTTQANIKPQDQSITSQLSVFDLIPFDKTQTNIKKISYNNLFFSSIKISKYNQDYKIKEKQIDKYFSF